MAKEAGTGSTEINPNAEVGAEPVQDRNAGEAVTFDDVEAITSATPAKAVAESGDKTQKEQETKKAKDATPAKPAKHGEDEPMLPGSEKRAGASVEAEPVAAKKVKAWDGDKEVEFGESVEFVQKVAGQPERVNLRTLLDNYSGRTNWDRKNNELSRSKKEFDENYQLVNSRITEAFEASKSGDPDKFITTMATLAGKDPVTAKKELMQPLIDWAMELADKSPAERDALLKEMELDTYKKMHESNTIEDQRRKQQAQLQQKAAMAKESYGISDQDYGAAINAIAQGRNAAEIDPMEVVQYHCDAISYAAVKAAMPGTMAEYESLSAEADRTGDAFTMDKARAIEDRVKRIWGRLRAMAMHERLQYSDLVDITKEAYGENTKPGEKEAKNLARKAAQAGTTPKAGALREPDDLISFDQLRPGAE